MSIKKKMEFDGSMILTLEDQCDPIEALMELFDNSVDTETAAARHISITLSSGALTIVDDGTGCPDPFVMINPFKSASRDVPRGIGVKGIGGKYGMALFGRRWLIQTVCRKVYRRIEYTWDENQKTLPEMEVQQLPLIAAPAEIRKGGTKITVTKRRPGISYNCERICRALERTYRPVLNNVIAVIKEPEEGFVRQLRNTALDASKFEAPGIQTKTGMAAGRSFTVRYGILKKPDETVRGCNIIFGPRVLQSWGNIGKYPLPSLCYVDVILNPAQWKTLLRSTKVGVRESKALDSAVEALLEDWLKELEATSRNIRIDLIFGMATGKINDSIAYLNKLIEGDFGPKPRKKAEPGPTVLRPPRPEPPLLPKPRRIRAWPDTGNFGAESAPGCIKLKIEPDSGLDRALYNSVYTPSQGVVTVFINTGPNQQWFAKAASRDGKQLLERAAEEARRIGLFAYAEAASVCRQESKPLFAALAKLGYRIDENTAAPDIIRMVMNFFYNDMAAGKLRIVREAAAA